MASAERTALADAAARVGDRWTLLVVHALLEGPRRFGELADAVGGVAPNVLTARLRQLEGEGIVVTSVYCERPLRVAYALTDAGRDLSDALRLLSQWGTTHPAPTASTPDAAAPVAPAHHGDCGTALEARWWCPTCDEAVEPSDADDVRFV